MKARLSFVLFALILIVVVVMPVGASAAALPKLVLTKTNPASPSSWSLPRIQGVVNEGGAAAQAIRAVGPPALFPPRTSISSEPENSVRIYTSSTCAGPIAAEGTVGTLEGEGILVNAPVASDETTTFYALQSNESDPDSDCSAGLDYRQVSTPPAAPIFFSVDPASPANDNSPLLIGSADTEATVWIYPTANCTGAPFTGSGAEFASAGIQVSVVDNSETTFSALAVLGGFSSTCSSAPISYREVTPAGSGGGSGEERGAGGGGSGGGGAGVGGAPGGTGGSGTRSGGGAASPGTPPQAPRIHTVPGGTSNDTTPLIAGSAPGGTTVKVFASDDCSGPTVAKGSAGQLGSGFEVQVVENSATVFSAVAVSGGGQSSCSNSVQYVEDSTPPRSRFTMGPASKTRHRTVVFRFMDITGNAPGTAFSCKLDKRKWRPCRSPLRLRRLRLARHTVKVKATDPAGNAESKPARRKFKVVARH